MQKWNHWICSWLVPLLLIVPALAGSKDSAEGKTLAEPAVNGAPAPVAASPTLTGGNTANVTALLGLLVMKGVLAPAEANAIRKRGSGG